MANYKYEKWRVVKIKEQYDQEIGNTTIQYFTKDQRTLVIDWYQTIYPHSPKVDYKKANRELIKLFEYHKL